MRTFYCWDKSRGPDEDDETCRLTGCTGLMQDLPSLSPWDCSSSVAIRILRDTKQKRNLQVVGTCKVGVPSNAAQIVRSCRTFQWRGLQRLAPGSSLDKRQNSQQQGQSSRGGRWCLDDSCWPCRRRGKLGMLTWRGESW